MYCLLELLFAGITNKWVIKHSIMCFCCSRLWCMSRLWTPTTSNWVMYDQWINKKCKYQQEYEDKVLNIQMFYLISFKSWIEKSLLKNYLILYSLCHKWCFFLQENNSGHRILVSLNSNKEQKENTLKQNYHYYEIFDLDRNYTTPL